MRTVLSAIFWIMVGAALVVSVKSAYSINSNLVSMEERIDEIDAMLDEMLEKIPEGN